MMCTRCGKEEVSWDFKEEQYCQECFETVANESYWDAFNESPQFFCLPEEPEPKFEVKTDRQITCER